MTRLQLDLKSLSSVCLLQDTKSKTRTVFDYTIKAFRSKKKLGLWFGVKNDLMSCVWLSIRLRTATESQSSVSLLEDRKPKTHTDFGYTFKAMRSKKKLC